MLREVLLELFYWPPVSWLVLAHGADVLWIEACEHYQKGSYRNRCCIAGPNGVQRLSVPLQKGKNRQMPIRDVRIAYDMPWQRSHWRTIRTAYGSAPFFEHFADEVAAFFEKRYDFLFDLNYDVLVFLWKNLNGRAQIQLTERYASPSERTTHPAVLDARGQIAWGQPPVLPLARYPQVFEDRFGFQPDLSALDLLFCCGPYVPWE
ncbi:MAG: WbqC family protein [Saprospiraceae bacterium]|nr:WbqC family protein [Saprospiraceae bacterium]MDW8228567.1 WbqC family protein [Saprospiraceae bacterium]